MYYTDVKSSSFKQNCSVRVIRMTVCSSIPGRIRIRHRLLKEELSLKAFQTFLMEQKGINEIEGQPLTGSLLIKYDPDILKYEFIKSIIETYFKRFFPKVFKGRKGRGWRDIVDVGMAFSLLTCVGSAFIWKKKLHIYSGLLFTVLTAEHIRLNKKRFVHSLRTHSKSTRGPAGSHRTP